MRVQELCYYPLKSAKAISVDRLKIGIAGPEWDRHWMVVGPEGHFLSQRRHPQMALIHTEIKNDQLILNAPNMPQLVVPKTPTNSISTASLWDANPKVVEVAENCSKWISEYLGTECFLVVSAPGYTRLVKEKYRVREDAQVKFADGFPLLITSLKSLDDLNHRLEQPVLMNRFRANIIIDGLEPFAEEQWKEISIDGHHFSLVKKCPRCVVINVDQDTGEKGREPLKTLTSYRKVENRIPFGMNSIHSSPCEISLGDSVELIA